MKSIENLKTIFDFFNQNEKSFVEIDKGINWNIIAYRPFERDKKTIYSFRLYGEIDGSVFKDYNNKPQWCAGVDYTFDLNTNKLERKEYEHKLHEAISKKINVKKTLNKI